MGKRERERGGVPPRDGKIFDARERERMREMRIFLLAMKKFPSGEKGGERDVVREGEERERERTILFPLFFFSISLFLYILFSLKNSFFKDFNF